MMMTWTFKENYMEQQQRHQHAELIHLWAEGAEIEMSSTGSMWVSITAPAWGIDTIYRVKPTLVKKTLWVQVCDTLGCVKRSKYADNLLDLHIEAGSTWHKVPSCTKSVEA